jgi:hypothetical protein
MDGLKVMINALSGGDAWAALRDAIGKTIASVAMAKRGEEKWSEDCIELRFSDGSGVRVWDDGQSCCEARYMNCDDDLACHAGATLMDAAIKEGPTATGEYGDEHEIEFFELATSKGVISVANHNEHNGYYGGFSLRSENLSCNTANAETA